MKKIPYAFFLFTLLSFALNILGCSGSDDDQQDAVYVKVAHKLAVSKYTQKDKHGEVEVFYYDAMKGRMLDASNPKDLDKLQSITGYGSSRSLDSYGYRSGAVGVPNGSFLKIEMNQKGEITGSFWVQEVEPISNGK